MARQASVGNGAIVINRNQKGKGNDPCRRSKQNFAFPCRCSVLSPSTQFLVSWQVGDFEFLTIVIPLMGYLKFVTFDIEQ